VLEDKHLFSYLTQFSLEQEIFQAKAVQMIKPHTLCSVMLFYESRAVYEIMWKIVAQPDRPQMTM
jgi:hypothetical protein